MKRLILLLSLLSCIALADTPPPNYQFQAPLNKSGVNVTCNAASGSQAGCLSSTDWTTFNGKQNALGFTPVNKAGDTMTGLLGVPNLQVGNNASPMTATLLDIQTGDDGSTAINPFRLRSANFDYLLVDPYYGWHLLAQDSWDGNTPNFTFDTVNSGGTNAWLLGFKYNGQLLGGFNAGGQLLSAGFSLYDPTAGHDGVINGGFQYSWNGTHDDYTLNSGQFADLIFSSTNGANFAKIDNWSVVGTPLWHFLSSPKFDTLTASTVPYLDANKRLASSTVTPTTLGYLDATSSIQTQLNGKEPTLTKGNLTDAGTDGITVAGGTNAVIGSGTSLSQHVADATHNGYLSSTDWGTFNGKQAALTPGTISTSTTGVTIGNGSASTVGPNVTVDVANAGASSPGLVSTGAQTFAGAKTFSGDTTVGGNVIFTPTTNSSLSGSNARIPSHTTANLVFTNAGLTSIGSANNGGVTGGHTLQITNETGAAITVVNNYGSAAAGEAIYTGSGADAVIPAGGTFWLQYDGTGSHWSFIGSSQRYYQTVQSNGTAQTKRSNLNFSTNFTTTDSSGSDRTTVDLASSIAATTFTGSVSLPNGSVSSPSLSFTSQTNNGIYYNPGTYVGLTWNGVDIVKYNGSNLVTTQQFGTIGNTSNAGAPAIYTVGDATTGLYWKSSGTWGFSSSGTNTVLLNGNGVEAKGGYGLLLDGSTSGTATVKAADSTTSYTVKMPSAQGTGQLGNDGSGNLSWSNVAQKKLLCLDPDQASCIIENFLGSGGTSNTGIGAAGGGGTGVTTLAPINQSSVPSGLQSSNHLGVYSMSSGTAAGGASVNLSSARYGTLGSIYMGGGEYILQGIVGVNPLSSASTAEYNVRFGCVSNNSGSDSANGVLFLYSRARTFTCSSTSTNSSSSITNLGSCSGVIDPSSIQTGMAVTDSKGCFQANTTVSVAPGAGTTLTLNQNTNASGCGASDTLTFTVGNYWIAQTAASSTLSTQVTSQAVAAATWYKLNVDVNAAASSAVFSINGSTVATITSNIPSTTSQTCSEGWNISNTAYTSGTPTFYLNEFFREQIFTSTR